MKDLTKGNPGKAIVSFAISILLGQLFQLFYNMADTRIVGMYLGDHSLAAIGATATIIDLLSGFVMGAANGFAADLVKILTDTENMEVIRTANLYLRIDTLFYIFLVPIFILRNSLQGLGDRKTPVLSSGIEMTGKIIAAFTLSRCFGYMGIIMTEPLTWMVMVIPLIVSMKRKLQDNAF